ncbi:MAG: C4-dicarboxylate TRAP transporter substrate-binding protein [Rhodobacteraceae bacterium]|nr:C4-dicarboxylate TRAP transporter substrate-binding protein [Paracoccaceae bacterium]
MQFSRKITAVTATALALGLMSGTPTQLHAQGAQVEGPQVTWRFSAWGTRRPFTEGIEAVAAHVAERTGGNFTINIVYGGQLSNPRENLDGIELGAFPMAMFCSSYHPAKHPSVMVLDLPFLPLPDLETTMAVHEAVFAHPQVAQEFAQWNAMLYMSAIIPQYELIGAGEAPRSLEDFRGKRVRALGGLGRAMSEIGATPTPVPPTDLYTSMGGVIDATMFPLSSSLAFRLHEVSTWFTADMSPGTLNCPTVISKPAFDALPAQYQELLMEAKAIGYEALIEANEAGTVEALELFEASMERVTFTDEEMDAFRAAAAEPIWDAWADENEAAGRPGRELLDLVLTTAARGGS